MEIIEAFNRLNISVVSDDPSSGNIHDGKNYVAYNRRILCKLPNRTEFVLFCIDEFVIGGGICDDKI